MVDRLLAVAGFQFVPFRDSNARSRLPVPPLESPAPSAALTPASDPGGGPWLGWATPGPELERQAGAGRQHRVGVRRAWRQRAL